MTDHRESHRFEIRLACDVNSYSLLMAIAMAMATRKREWSLHTAYCILLTRVSLSLLLPVPIVSVKFTNLESRDQHRNRRTMFESLIPKEQLLNCLCRQRQGPVQDKELIEE